MAPVLAQADRLMQRPGFARLRGAIIEYRNRAVEKVLDRELERGPRRRWLSIFYGAGHMPDFHGRLTATGWTYQGIAWSDAWTVEPRSPAGPARSR